MLEVGWSELLVIAIVMIVVVGPKDLPKMLRTFAMFAKKARGMANDFQSQFTDAMRDADLDDVRKTIADVRSLNPKNALKDAFDPIRKAGEDVKREMQGAQNSISDATAPTPSAPVMAASSPIIDPVMAPLPSVTLPNALPTELAAVAVKPKTAKTKTAPQKAAVVVSEPPKKPRAKKTVVKA